MITKRHLIELLQSMLNGGSTPVDRRRVYPSAMVSRIVNLGLLDCLTKKGKQGGDMAQMQLSYEFAPQEDSKGWFVELSPKPLGGSYGLYGAECDGKEYITVDYSSYKSIKGIGQDVSEIAYYKSGKLRFAKKPIGDVTVSILPNFYEMADDDVVIYTSDENGQGAMAFFALCLQVLSGEKPIDEKNNNNAQA